MTHMFLPGSNKMVSVFYKTLQNAVPNNFSIYRIYSNIAAPSNCAALQYYSKGFILVSGNNVNCTTPSIVNTYY